MTQFNSGKGDESFSGLLGGERAPKSDPRFDAVGTIDESNAALGLARAQCQGPEVIEIILHVQRDLYRLMTEVATSHQTAKAVRTIGVEQVTWLETQVERMSQSTRLPDGFIIPGDCAASAALDLARAIVRRAERRVVALFESGELENQELIRYLNRLSFLIFMLELHEIYSSGKDMPTLAKA